MAKIPKTPEEIFPEITADFQKIFGEDLVSIILYGSGAGGDYVPGKSDLNFLITLTDRASRGSTAPWRQSEGGGNAMLRSPSS
jgi:hypothetical protein